MQLLHFGRENNSASTENLIKSPFFTTNILKISAGIKKDYSELDSFVILFCTEGGLKVEWEDQNYTLVAGEVILLPNVIENITLLPDPNAIILEVYIE